MRQQAEFLQLLERHQNIIHKICHLYQPKHSDREDLFQEITLQAWKAFSSFRGDAKFSTWLYKVALNTALVYRRKEIKQQAELVVAQVPDRAEAANDGDEQYKAMYQSISRLSDIDKAIVMLYIEDYSHEEIGAVVGITANNVAVKINRIKVKLREETKKHYPV